MKLNTSLSARIKRRNAQGFEGKGTPSDFIPKIPGDYKSVLYNHKKNIGVAADGSVVGVPDMRQHLVNRAKSRCRWIKHPGSKTIKQLKQLPNLRFPLNSPGQSQATLPPHVCLASPRPS